MELHQSIVARVQVLDYRGQLVPAKYFPLMNLKTHIDVADVIALKYVLITLASIASNAWLCNK